jgi:hypothetical protein
LLFDVIDVLSPLIGYRGCIRTHGEHVLEQVLQLAPLDLEWEVDGLLLCGIAGATTTGLS